MADKGGASTKRVGKYEVGKTLGEGTFGKVKGAVNTETGEKVAIKVLDKDKIQKQNMGPQIKKEIVRARRGRPARSRRGATAPRPPRARERAHPRRSRGRSGRRRSARAFLRMRARAR